MSFIQVQIGPTQRTEFLVAMADLTKVLLEFGTLPPIILKEAFDFCKTPRMTENLSRVLLKMIVFGLIDLL